MRALLVGCVIVAGCGGDGAPKPTDGGVNDAAIDAAGPNPTKITVTLDDAPSAGAAFGFVAAYQDGDGAWKPAPRSGDTYMFDVRAATWGFAYTCQVNVIVAGVVTALRDVVAYHFAVAERTSLTEDILARCTDRLSYVALSGNLANRAAAGTYRIAYNGKAVFIDKATGNYDMLVEPGTHDLLVLHGSNRNTPENFLVDSAIVQRDVVVGAAMTLNVDVRTMTPTVALGVAVSGAGAPISSETTTNLFTGDGTSVTMAHVTKTPLASTAFAAAQAAADDVYDQRVTVELVADQPVTTTTATATPAAVSIMAPAPLGATATASAATTPYPRFTSTWPSYAGAIGYTWTLAQTPPADRCGSAPSCTITWTASVSPGAAGAMPSYTMPDLSTLPGWSEALQLVAGTMATGDVAAMTSSAGAIDFPPNPPVAGTSRVFAHATFTVMP